MIESSNIAIWLKLTTFCFGENFIKKEKPQPLEEEPFLVLIESEKLAKSLKPLFEVIWEASKEI